jgi:hypothetical protein
VPSVLRVVAHVPPSDDVALAGARAEVDAEVPFGVQLDLRLPRLVLASAVTPSSLQDVASSI